MPRGVLKMNFNINESKFSLKMSVLLVQRDPSLLSQAEAVTRPGFMEVIIIFE